MSRFIVTLTDSERDRLEQMRAALGLRSQADVIRHWINGPVPSERRHFGQPSAKTLALSRSEVAGAIVPFDPVTGEPIAPEKPGARLKKR